MASLHHDSRLANSDLRPDIVVLVDAPQLSSSGADLIIAIRTLRERFPAALLWTPGLGGPDNAALLAWMGVDLLIHHGLDLLPVMVIYSPCWGHVPSMKASRKIVGFRSGGMYHIPSDPPSEVAPYAN